MMYERLYIYYNCSASPGRPPAGPLAGLPSPPAGPPASPSAGQVLFPPHAIQNAKMPPFLMGFFYFGSKMAPLSKSEKLGHVKSYKFCLVFT